ncbi:hypothetical protein FACS1894170_04510 [Planctomycetales bacterium]|nr:hypothetical protein FACS1894170_04510 [Planctomycetales bacterium]
MSAMVEKRTDPVEEIWAIREKIYEETKDLTTDEMCAYWRQAVADYKEYAKHIHPQPDMFPWLKQDKQPV